MAIEITQPDAIQNLDILDLVYRLDRWLLELQNCVSATRNEFTVPDIKRSLALQADVKRKFAIYKEDDELDLPKYHPISRPLPPPPALEIKQNVDVMNLTETIIALRTEMVMSGASERVTSFSKAQAERVGAVLERLDTVLSDIEENPEVDSPNSPDEKPGDKKK